MSSLMVFVLIIVMAVVTIAIRFAPFVIFKGKDTPKYVTFLGEYLPYPIIGMLVVYCLKGVSFVKTANYMPELLATAVVVALHVWKRNTLLSIVTGTFFYMMLKQMIFV